MLVGQSFQSTTLFIGLTIWRLICVPMLCLVFFTIEPTNHMREILSFAYWHNWIVECVYTHTPTTRLLNYKDNSPIMLWLVCLFYTTHRTTYNILFFVCLYFWTSNCMISCVVPSADTNTFDTLNQYILSRPLPFYTPCLVDNLVALLFIIVYIV